MQQNTQVTIYGPCLVESLINRDLDGKKDESHVGRLDRDKSAQIESGDKEMTGKFWNILRRESCEGHLSFLAGGSVFTPSDSSSWSGTQSPHVMVPTRLEVMNP